MSEELEKRLLDWADFLDDGNYSYAPDHARDDRKAAAELKAGRERIEALEGRKLFPLQVSRREGIKPGPRKIPWSIAEKAYGVYSAKYGTSQTLERLAERGGFGWCEMDDFYPEWRQEIGEVARAQQAEAAHAKAPVDIEKLTAMLTSGSNQILELQLTLEKVQKAAMKEGQTINGLARDISRAISKEQREQLPVRDLVAERDKALADVDRLLGLALQARDLIERASQQWPAADDRWPVFREWKAAL